MSVYAITTKDPNQRLFRVSAFCVICFLSVVLVVSLYDPFDFGDRTAKILGGVAFAGVIASMIGAMFFAVRGGTRELQLKSNFELTKEELVQTREGYPTISIALSEIAAIFEMEGWLVVRGQSPAAHIAIPSEVERFDELKQRLATYCNIRQGKSRSWLFSIPPLLIMIAIYAALFLARNASVVVAAGCAAIALHIWGFFSLRRLFGARRASFGVSALYVFACLLIILWLVYERIRAVG